MPERAGMEKKGKKDVYYFNDVIRILRHPYIRNYATSRGHELMSSIHFLSEKISVATGFTFRLTT